MLAVKGLYNDGQIVFKKKLLFEEFSGSVDRMIDVKEEKRPDWCYFPCKSRKNGGAGQKI